MLANQSHLFDVPADVAYFNTAYFGPRLHSVADAAAQAVALTGRPWEVGADLFFDPVERLRDEVASLLNADADGVALIAAISYGAGTAAANLVVGEGRTVVTLAEQFPSNVYAWRTKVAANGGEIVTVPRNPAGWTHGILEAIDERTAVVVVPNCHWTDGSKVDLIAVSKAAKNVGAALCVDASQSLGAMPFDVGLVQPDFVYAVGYKWLLGFYGLGYMWVAPQHRSGRPLEEGWAVRKDAQNFSGLVDYTDVYEDGARRFDVGERSNFIAVAMATAAVSQVNAWGADEINETIARTNDRIAAELSSRGWSCAPIDQRSGHLLGVRRQGGLPPDLGDRLREEGVHVSIRGDSIRIAPHLHTTDSDVERLLGVLGR